MLEQAVILCAGKGTRLGNLTESLPKPMLPVRGPNGAEPLLSAIVRKLKSASFHDIVLVVGYRSQMITDFFGGFEGIRFVHQTKLAGTAAALELTVELLHEQFLLTYGDLAIDEADYRGIRAAAISDGGNWAALDHRQRPVGAADVEGDRIVRIVEKPDTCSTLWNTSGLFVLTREAATLASATTQSRRGEREIAQLLQIWIDRRKDLKPYYLTCRSLDIGAPERYETLRSGGQGVAGSCATSSSGDRTSDCHGLSTPL